RLGPGAEVQGKAVPTIEGIATGQAPHPLQQQCLKHARSVWLSAGVPPGLHPLQQKFLEHAALQCGICTPGFIVAAKALLENNPKASEEQVRHWLAGNLCRCTGYDKIIRAVLDAGCGTVSDRATTPGS